MKGIRGLGALPVCRDRCWGFLSDTNFIYSLNIIICRNMLEASIDEHSAAEKIVATGPIFLQIHSPN